MIIKTKITLFSFNFPYLFKTVPQQQMYDWPFGMTDLIVDTAYEKKKIWKPVTPARAAFAKEEFGRTLLAVHSD